MNVTSSTLLAFHRCNDVLELLQTTSHFCLLSDAAEIGGAGTPSLDAVVRDIHSGYVRATQELHARVPNVLQIDGSHLFEVAFFNFRRAVKVSKILIGSTQQNV